MEVYYWIYTGCVYRVDFFCNVLFLNVKGIFYIKYLGQFLNEKYVNIIKEVEENRYDVESREGEIVEGSFLMFIFREIKNNIGVFKKIFLKIVNKIFVGK